MSQDQQFFRRAAGAALVGILVQLLLSVVLALVGLWSDSPALSAATWHALGGVPVWAVLWLIYKQHQIERAEALEVEAMARRAEQGAAIFEEQADELRVARRRLEQLYTWGLNVVSLALAAYLLAVGGTFLALAWRKFEAGTLTTAALSERAADSPGLLMAFMAGAAFVAFVTGRYAAGMTSVGAWQLLRGGAGYLMGTALVAGLALSAGLALVFRWNEPMAWLALAVPAIMVLVGVEIVLSYLAGAYRPRKPGEIPRPAFDSRLLGWLTKPESLAKIVNETINYQFGFEISTSWFYQLLSRALTPLLVAGLAALVLLSSIVIVSPQQQALVTTFGKISRPPLDPGLYLKWPWPIGAAEHYDVGRVQQIVAGSYTRIRPNVAILWTNEHVEGKEEYVLTAPTDFDAGPSSGAMGTATLGQDTPASSLVAAQLHVHYVIRDLVRYISAVQEPARALAAIANHSLTAYCAAKDVDTLIGAGRRSAGDDLLVMIQREADALDLGVHLTFVGLTGIHPPQSGEVAQAFHEQIGALQEKETAIWKARQQAIQSLAEVAGSVEMAQRIHQAVRGLEQARAQLEALRQQGAADAAMAAQAAVLADQEALVESLVVQAPGKAAQTIYQARAQRWETGIGERARAGSFPADVVAWNYAPRYFEMRRYLDVLGDTLIQPRKYIVTGRTQAPGIYRLDLKDAATALEGFLQPSQ